MIKEGLNFEKHFVFFGFGVTMDDGRAISGTFLAHDKYLNSSASAMTASH